MLRCEGAFAPGRRVGPDVGWPLCARSTIVSRRESSRLRDTCNRSSRLRDTFNRSSRLRDTCKMTALRICATRAGQMQRERRDMAACKGKAAP